MQTKTKKRNKYKSNALNRSAHSWNGAMLYLRLIQRADNTENTVPPIANIDALDLLSHFKGNF